MTDSLQQRYESSPLFGANAPLVEMFYERYLDDPHSVAPVWREYFAGISDAGGGEIAHGPIREDVARRARAGMAGSAVAGQTDARTLEKQSGVLRLIWSYRLHGHKLAKLDPLGLQDAPEVPDLNPAYHGLGDEDLDTRFYAEHLAGHEQLTLREIIALSRKIYSRRIGAEFAHLSDTSERQWLRQRLEVATVEASLGADEKRAILEQLTVSEGIERYLHTRYVGQKRFSLEGCESLIPLLDDLVQRGGAGGVREVVIGMAHRGRINVLVNVLGKSPAELFSEFEGLYDARVVKGSGDVKYHLGFSTDVPTQGGNVHLVLAFNPSHLEIVNPVVEGSVRSRQDRRGDREGSRVMPILIHGDAAFSGQGVVSETLQMSRIRGFATGGTVHVVCNNQIGFTTSDPRDTRSTPYCSDMAKLLEAPVLHVNGDDPESVLLVTRLALEYRQTFRKDVVIDLVCYRRHGHNEADEPAVTQPVMYRAIRKLPPVRRAYAQKLAEAGIVSDEASRQLVDEYRQGLDEGRLALLPERSLVGDEHTVDWSPFLSASDAPCETGLPVEATRDIAARLEVLPEGFQVHPRVKRILDDRKKMAAGDLSLDWGFAETMAYGSLLIDGYSVRLTGQDAGRGTFFHRHAILHNQEDNVTFLPLAQFANEKQRFNVWDSFLSEEAVLGFEYGYATTDPKSLVIWEAQFGDFGNGAQVVIDQFISSGETKWGRVCGLALFLPHGYEGQGPEHSSARLERFLQLCAEHNMQVCVPSTPAQMFHMLRRQMLQTQRKPLVVMTPKSLLRHRESVSSLEELAHGGFQLLIDEIEPLDTGRITRVVFCSGKVYFDLLEARRKQEIDDVAIVRVEQLYPFPIESYAELIAQYSSARDIVWCQEEPLNQGAWYQIRHRLQEALGGGHTLSYAGREASASPASGYYHKHVHQQETLVNEALGISLEAEQAAGKRKKA